MRNPTSETGRANKTTPCCIKVGLKRGPWTPEEDQLLSSYIEKEGEGRWRTLPKRAGLLRCGKSCRLRWMNYLRPSVKRGQIASDEEDLILRLHRLLGNRWSLIAGRIPGRTDNEIKNYWNTHLSKKLISQGIDPRTHKPLNPNPNSSPHSTAPAPGPNPNPSSSGNLEEELGGMEDCNAPPKVIDTNCTGNGYLEGPTNQIGSGGAHDYDWQNSDGMMMMMGLQQDHDSRGISYNNDDDMDSCNDIDVLSSFLNSLIDEDTFLKQQQQQNMCATNTSDNSLLPSMVGYNGCGEVADWNAEVPISQKVGVDGEECHDHEFADHVG